MDLKELREQIDIVDQQLTELLTRRMDIAQDIALWKREQKLPALDARREREKLNAITEAAREDMEQPLRVMYSLLFELSRTRQNALLQPQMDQADEIRNAIVNTPQLFPESAQVACQGVEGAYSIAACERLFRNPRITYIKTFEGVISAITSGLCDYGILPIENSTAGSVKEVYDLLVKHKCYIVRSTRIKINHALLARRGTKLENIREIYSHEQALSQCQENLAKLLPAATLHPCSNTAAAAKLVAGSERNDIAALSSYHCAALYDLCCLHPDIQDNDNNHTRFICIARRPEIYPGANKTTLMLTVPHKPGALYKVLARLYCLGLNVQKLESRPIANRDFEFMFYFDIESSIYSTQFDRMLNELGEVCEELHYLGSYLEIV